MKLSEPGNDDIRNLLEIARDLIQRAYLKGRADSAADIARSMEEQGLEMVKRETPSDD